MSSVNFLNVDHDAVARCKTLALAGVFTLFVALISFAGAAASYRSAERGTSVFTEFGNLPVISDVRQLVFGDSPAEVGTITGQADNEPNLMRVLVLGIGGAGHDGSLLTDSIMLATVDLDDAVPRQDAEGAGHIHAEAHAALNVRPEQRGHQQRALVRVR